MHSMDGTDFSVFSILPPDNTVHAHLLHNGNLVATPPRNTVTGILNLVEGIQAITVELE